MLRSGLALLRDALPPAEHEARARATGDRAGVDLERDPLDSGWLLRGRLDDLTGLADLPSADWPIERPGGHSIQEENHIRSRQASRGIVSAVSTGRR